MAGCVHGRAKGSLRNFRARNWEARKREDERGNRALGRDRGGVRKREREREGY